MARVDVLSKLYATKVSPLDFVWENLTAPPMLSLLSLEDIFNLNRIATSNKLTSKPKEKYRLIDQIVRIRGFKKIASGTNRVVYKYLNDQSICIKIAFDKVGIKDNPMEYRNQFLLKPFVTRMFEVSQCGTVALCERVEPIVTKEEFLNVANDIFDMLINNIIGKYVVNDIGSRFYQNYGIRVGFGPVLLDYPYVFEVDGKKLICNNTDPITKVPCLGEIDFDDGLNFIRCTKCGKEFHARQLEKSVYERNIIVETRGVKSHMSISLFRGDQLVKTIETGKESNVINHHQDKKINNEKDNKRKGVRILNMKSFKERISISKDRDTKINESIDKSRDKYEEKIKKSLDDIKNIYTENPKVKNKVKEEPKVKEIDLAKVAEEKIPGYLQYGRFARVSKEEAKPSTPETNNSISVDSFITEIKDHLKVPSKEESVVLDENKVIEEMKEKENTSIIEEEKTKPEYSFDNPLYVKELVLNIKEEKTNNNDETLISEY